MTVNTVNLSAGDIEEAFETLGYDADGEEIEDFDGEGGWETVAWEWDDSKVHMLPVGDLELPVKVVESSSGTYDGDTYIILEVAGTTYRKNGYSASHDGTYYDGSFEQVEPYEKTVKYWRTVR